MSRFFRKLRGDTRGVTIVEMGFVIVPLTITLLVLFDFSYRMYAQSVVEGTLERAARLATIGDKTDAQIDDFVRSQLTVFSKYQPPIIEKTSYYQFSGANKTGEICNDDGDKILEEDQGEYYKDRGTSGIGGSDDVVFYTVTLKFPSMFPLKNFLGWSAMEQVTANTVLRNQPYGAQSVPTC